MVDTLQSYITMLGLLIDIVGVVMVGHYWVQPVGGGLQRLLKLQTDLNLDWSAQAKKAVAAQAKARASGQAWWRLFLADLGIALRRGNARLYQGRVDIDRKTAELPPLRVLTSEDLWNDEAIHQHFTELRDHYLTLVDEGAPNSRIPLWGFRLIVGGFGLQFLGALPV